METEAPPEPSPWWRWWTPGRVVVMILVVGMLTMWGYVLYLAFGPGRQDPVDRLHDPRFASAAEARCNEAHDAVAQLPAADQTSDAADRAVVIHQANQTFAAMLDDLEAMAPPGEDGTITEEWIADWRTYLADREAFATALAHGPRGPTPRDGEGQRADHRVHRRLRRRQPDPRLRHPAGRLSPFEGHEGGPGGGRHPERPGVEVEGGEVTERDPAHPLGLVVDRRHRPRRGQHQVAHVQVEVIALGAGGVVEHMDIEIDRRPDDDETHDPGLLLGLPQGDVGEVAVAVSVTAGLQPALHLGVEQQEHPLP